MDNQKRRDNSIKRFYTTCKQFYFLPKTNSTRRKKKKEKKNQTKKKPTTNKKTHQQRKQGEVGGSRASFSIEEEFYSWNGFEFSSGLTSQ